MLLSLLTTLSACVHQNSPEFQEVREVEVTSTYEKCPAPDSPELKPILEEQHIGSRDNVNRVISNTVENQAYINGLKATIECYEAQASKADNDEPER